MKEVSRVSSVSSVYVTPEMVARVDRAIADLILTRNQMAAALTDAPKAAPLDTWLTTAQIAERLCIEEDTVRKACRENGIGEEEQPGRGKRKKWRVSLERARKHFRR